MADPPVPLYDIQYRRLFPWLHLTRAFWIAIDPRKLLLAGAALMLASLGTLLIDQLPFSQAASPEAGTAQDAGRWPWQWSLGYDRWHGNDGARSCAVRSTTRAIRCSASRRTGRLSCCRFAASWNLRRSFFAAA